MSSNQSVNIQPRPNVKQINYISKTFTDFRQNLIDFTKAYYPNTYSDFNEASPGMMFIEMAAYVGDVLSFYIDNQFKENLLAYAEQQENIISMAQFLGYKPKLTSPATTVVTLYQTAPAILRDGVYVPDSNYLVKLGKGSTFSNPQNAGTLYRLTEDVDFRDITTNNYIITEFSAGNPARFIVSKTAPVVAASEKAIPFSFSAPQAFTSITLPDDDIIGIESVVDSNGNPWYEVDYLAQDVIMEDFNVASNNDEDGNLPSVKLRLKQVPRRFVTRISRDGRVELLFGSGTSNEAELNTTLDSRQVANAQYGNTIQNILGNAAINNVNFLNSNAYGVSPANTVLTVTYLVGGGLASNTPSNTINTISRLIVLNDTTTLNAAQLSDFTSIVQNIAVNNELPATGGGTGESLEEIRQNALAFFNAQSRVVTVEDYVVRTYSLPARYGRISKSYAVRDEQINRILAVNDERVYVDNPVRPNAINLYTLGYDSNGSLTTLNTTVKENLARYLDQFRMLTDDVNILDAFIINIGVQFDISVLRNYNINDVLARSIDAVNQFFDINKWSINQPIIIADLMYEIGLVDGVQSVRDVRIFNKYEFKDGTGYQNYRYDIDEATVNGVVYPSLDPSIFELKYPQSDIIGNATQ